jgi:hypothetical protein
MPGSVVSSRSTIATWCRDDAHARRRQTAPPPRHASSARRYNRRRLGIQLRQCTKRFMAIVTVRHAPMMASSRAPAAGPGRGRSRPARGRRSRTSARRDRRAPRQWPVGSATDLAVEVAVREIVDDASGRPGDHDGKEHDHKKGRGDRWRSTTPRASATAAARTRPACRAASASVLVQRGDEGHYGAAQRSGATSACRPNRPVRGRNSSSDSLVCASPAAAGSHLPVTAPLPIQRHPATQDVG